LAQSEFGAEAPAATLHRLRRETDAGRSGPRLTPAHIFQAAQKDQSAENLERLRRASNGWERLATAWHILFPPVPAMQRIYGAQPPSRIALYYLLRPFHLLLRQGRALLRRIRPQSVSPPEQLRAGVQGEQLSHSRRGEVGPARLAEDDPAGGADRADLSAFQPAPQCVTIYRHAASGRGTADALDRVLYSSFALDRRQSPRISLV